MLSGVVVNAAIVSGKAPRPAFGGHSDAPAKIPTYIGAVSIHRGDCVVTVNPTVITVAHHGSLSWSHNTSVSCGHRRQFRVDISSASQV